MFGIFRRAKRKQEPKSVELFCAEPTRADVELVRRWGVVTNTGVSDQQFNVYTISNGYLVTLQTSDGNEVESDGTGLFRGGACDSIGQAYERAASFVTDILTASGMSGLPCTAIVLMDTSPGRDAVHLSHLEYSGGAVSETRYIDPDTLNALTNE